jgi:hypothetical protein
VPATLPANALTTLDALADELGISVDGSTDLRLARYIGVASDFIESWCGRKFGKLQRTERYRGYGQPRLWLRTPPLDTNAAITVTIDGAALVLDTDFRVDDPDFGTLWRPSGWEKTAAYVAGADYEALDGQEESRWIVTYTGGYVLPKDATTLIPRTLPYDIEQVCLELICSKYAQRGKDRSVTSERLLSWSATYGASDITDSMQTVLASYKSVVV